MRRFFKYYRFSKQKNYGLCIDNTYGLRISNCIHADGLIRFCSDVTYESNHNERGSLTIHYTNISIYNCRFHKPLREPAIIISEYNWSETARQCFHSVLLEGVVFVLHDYSEFHYNTDIEEIRFCGRNATRLYYKNVQVTTFGPVPSRNPDAVVRPSTGFRFSKYVWAQDYTTYDCAFREGWIEMNNNVAHYMTNQTIVSHINPASYSIGYAIVDTTSDSFPSFSDNGTYKYDIWMVNDRYGGTPIGVKLAVSQMANYSDQSESIIGSPTTISVTIGSFVRFSLVCNNDITNSINAIDGCFIIIKRTKTSNNTAVYARLPVSHNGHFVDTGEWINARKWVTENLAPSNYRTLTNGMCVTIYDIGIYKIQNPLND